MRFASNRIGLASADARSTNTCTCDGTVRGTSSGPFFGHRDERKRMCAGHDRSHTGIRTDDRVGYKSEGPRMIGALHAFENAAYFFFAAFFAAFLGAALRAPFLAAFLGAAFFAAFLAAFFGAAFLAAFFGAAFLAAFFAAFFAMTKWFLFASNVIVCAHIFTQWLIKCSHPALLISLPNTFERCDRSAFK